MTQTKHCAGCRGWISAHNYVPGGPSGKCQGLDTHEAELLRLRAREEAGSRMAHWIRTYYPEQGGDLVKRFEEAGTDAD